MLLCVHVPAFKLAVARRPFHICGEKHVFLLADKADRGRVLEVDERAYALGARSGQTVLQACIAAGGRVLLHDAANSRAIWDDMLDALDAVSPLVDDAGEGTAFAEMRGCDGMASDWIVRAHQALSEFDLPVRVAAGPNKFTARAATYVRDGCICAPDEAAQLVDPLPVEVLDAEPGVIERLQLLGIRTLGELARLPHGPFVRRFGARAARWHDYARGIDPAPFRPRPYTLQIEAAAFGEGSAAQEEQVYFALRVLAERVCSDLARAGKAVASLRTTFECENGDRREVESGFAQPTGEPRTILAILRAKLERLVFDAPITGLRLQALRLEECGSFATLFASSEPDPQALAIAFERLHAIGGTRVQQAHVQAAHLLESRVLYCPFDSRSLSRAVSRGSLRTGSVGATRDEGTYPQLRMLAVREIAVTLRGNAPARVDERRVVNCAGPWRVDDGWFASPLCEQGEEANSLTGAPVQAPARPPSAKPMGPPHVARDEYDVQLEDGMLCRIYRQGQQWYLRGAYD